MIIRTNAPSALDGVIKILSENMIDCTKKNNNEISIIGIESNIRILLQKKLDEAKFDFVNDYVLCDGNYIWSYDRITKELAKIKKKNSTEGISRYFYNFMHHNFTGAHYNIHGWAAEYPTWDHVKSVLTMGIIDCPSWKTDVQSILHHNKEVMYSTYTYEVKGS